MCVCVCVCVCVCACIYAAHLGKERGDLLLALANVLGEELGALDRDEVGARLAGQGLAPQGVGSETRTACVGGGGFGGTAGGEGEGRRRREARGEG